jgi:hypothetical protein
MMTHLIIVGSPKVLTPPSIEFLAIGHKTYLLMTTYVHANKKVSVSVPYYNIDYYKNNNY